MLFFNFLGRSSFEGNNGFLPLRISDSVLSSEEDFPSCEVYYENGEVIISEPDSSKTSVFKCNDERALEVNNKIERNKEEDFLIMTDKVGFIENVKAYFRFIPFDGGILLCLYGGAIKINDGTDWMVLSRNGKGTKEGAVIHPITYSEFVGSVSSSDPQTEYNMVKDGVSSCEVIITNNKFGITKKTRSFRDEFTLLDDTGLKRATEVWNKKQADMEAYRLEKEEKKRQYKEREAEFKKREAEREAAEKAEKEKKAAKKNSTKAKTSKKKSEAESDAAGAFISAVLKAGYNRGGSNK